MSRETSVGETEGKRLVVKMTGLKMKIWGLVVKWFGVMALAFWASGHQGFAAEADALEQPRILSVRIDDDDFLVEVNVPEGFKRITLESRTRLGQGSWVPRGVKRFDGSGSTFTFRLKLEETLEILRVVGTVEDLLPESFYGGKKTFAGPSSGPAKALPGAPVAIAAPGLEAPAVREPEADEASGAPRDIVESDIWQVRGNRMYFFNQYRGLQVIDISRAEQPKILGTLELPASGEQMYVLGENHVALLARDTCNYFGGGAESRVVIAEVGSGVPAMVASLPVKGSISESRLVGSALYLASQSFRPSVRVDERTGQEEQRWEWGTHVSSFDLSQPDAPEAREEHWIPGSGHVIHATSDYLFVSTQGTGSRWWQSRIEVIDISSPDGSLVPLSQIRPAGRVIDKFKMHVSGEVFTVISEVRTRSLVTRLETFDLSNPRRPVKLGAVEVGRNESLHATRFDGNKAYIVTFFRIDPLWVVDLTDPANPTISGELEVPGWSTYIQPLGDRLLSIGIDDQEGWRVAVSLFDVRDPAKPGLLSRVPLGSNNSWSEANRDEKALGFVPEAGLVMVPFSAYEKNVNRTGVQLVELVGDELVLRGVIDHEVTPRRATVHQERILSLSGKSLLTVDASDYDEPKVLSDFPLSWAVDRVFVEGDFLIEVTQGNAWTDESPAIRIASQADPYEVLSKTRLPQPNVVGAVTRGDRLYVVQADQNHEFPMMAETAEVDGENPTDQVGVLPMNFRVAVYGLGSLPELPLLGEKRLHVEGASGASNPQLLFPHEDVLTVSFGRNHFFYGGPVGIVADIAIGRPWFGGASGRRFVSFRVGTPADIEFLSNYLMETGDAWSQSEVFAAGTLFYMTHQSSRLIGEEEPPEIVVDPRPGGKPAVDGENDVAVLPIGAPEPFPGGRWVQQYFLDVIDFADPVNPTQREPVNSPGALIGLGRNGALVYTKAPHWDDDTLLSDGMEWLDVSAYDGVSLSLIDSLSLSFTWPHPTLVDSDVVYLGLPATRGRLRQGERRRSNNTLTTYRLADTGNFESLSEIALPFPVSELRAENDLLLAKVGQELWFYGLETSGALAPLGTGSQSNCFGFNLQAADGSVESGIWVPGGDYGVSHIPLGEDLDRVVAVHAGTFFGLCFGYCQTRLEVKPGLLSFSAFSRDEEVGDFFRSESLDGGEWRDLLERIDLEFLGGLPPVIGCPDCADGGGEWLQVFTPMGEAKVTFPLGTAVKGITPLLERIREFRGRFKVPEVKRPRPEEEPIEDEPSVELPPIPVPLPLPLPAEPALLPEREE